MIFFISDRINSEPTVVFVLLILISAALRTAGTECLALNRGVTELPDESTTADGTAAEPAAAEAI